MLSSCQEAYHWDQFACRWHHWGPPLRPSPEDIGILESAVARWSRPSGGDDLHALLCGVTPEIAGMAWPDSTRLLAVDRSPAMIHRVWPGDVPGRRRAVTGDWFDLPVEPNSQDVVIGDGCLATLDYPASQQQWAAALHRVLRPQGMLVVRCFVQPPERESLDELFQELAAGQIGSFHAFKWRLAMALQDDCRQGVRMCDIWTAWRAAGIDQPQLLARTRWPQAAVDTLDLYQGHDGRLNFPTLAEHRELFSAAFEELAIEVPHYELGERCPTLVYRARTAKRC